jgi:hypothetical protein
MDDISSHGNQLFLFLMAIPIQLFFVFVLSHLLPSFLDHASHNLSFLIFSWFNPSMKPPLTLSLSRQGRGNLTGQSTQNPLPLGDCVVMNEKLLPLQHGTGGRVTKL